MTARPDRLLIVFSDPLRNRLSAASYQTLTDIGDGRDMESLQPIDAEQLETLLPGFNAGTLAERDALQAQVTELTADLETASSQAESLASQVTELSQRPTQAQFNAANEQIAALELQLHPPNPFPDADWPGFRQAALTDPAVQRVAAGNSVLWPVLFAYLSELSTNPARGQDIAWLWNTMESQTPVGLDDVARVNAMAEEFGVPLRMNTEGQIVA